LAALAVLGAGAWGTAIAAALSSRHRVILWARDAAQARAMGAARRNLRYLPEIELPESLVVTHDAHASPVQQSRGGCREFAVGGGQGQCTGQSARDLERERRAGERAASHTDA